MRLVLTMPALGIVIGSPIAGQLIAVLTLIKQKVAWNWVQGSGFKVYLTELHTPICCPLAPWLPG